MAQQQAPDGRLYCRTCGGLIPLDSSEAWDASEGEHGTHGQYAADNQGVCTCFDAALDQLGKGE